MRQSLIFRQETTQMLLHYSIMVSVWRSVPQPMRSIRCSVGRLPRWTPITSLKIASITRQPNKPTWVYNTSSHLGMRLTNYWITSVFLTVLTMLTKKPTLPLKKHFTKVPMGLLLLSTFMILQEVGLWFWSQPFSRWCLVTYTCSWLGDLEVLWSGYLWY